MNGRDKRSQRAEHSRVQPPIRRGIKPVKRKPLCPECAQGKSINCVGQALDLVTDEFVPCATTSH